MQVFIKKKMFLKELLKKCLNRILFIANTFYKAAIAKGLIATNPANSVKAPTERVDPASNISYLELDELELLLGEIESQLYVRYRICWVMPIPELLLFMLTLAIAGKLFLLRSLINPN